MTIQSLIEKQRHKHPPFCSRDITVFDAAVMIAALDINALAVVETGKLKGIITDHDVLRCLVDSGAAFSEQRVNEWMTPKPITCSVDVKLTHALKLMAERGIRHLPVLAGERVKTVISSKELLSRIHADDALEIGVLRDIARASSVALS